MFNRNKVEMIVHVSDLPVVPRSLQLDMTSLSPRWKTGKGALRVLIYFYGGQTRFLTAKYNEKLRSHQDITDTVVDLQLSIPELEETVLDGNVHEVNGGHKVIITDCLRFRGLLMTDSGDSARHAALNKVFGIIGQSEKWTRVMQD
jgi:hypothetical protein